MRNWTTLAAMIVGVALGAEAQAAFFDLRGTQGADVDGLASGPTTIQAITATLAANDGVLNQTTSGFGVNASVVQFLIEVRIVPPDPTPDVDEPVAAET